MKRDITERKRIARAIRTYIARENISRDELADRTRLAKSTIGKLLAGVFSDKTLLQVETAVAQAFRATPTTTPRVAPEHYGGYSRADMERYLGMYVFARPSFVGDSTIHAFPMEIVWDETIPALLISEKRSGVIPAQRGHVFMPRSSMHVFIQSNEQGWLKQLILSRIDVYNCMKGVMLTMGEVFANVYMPVIVPAFLRKSEAINEEMVGKLRPGSAHYDAYRADLTTVEKAQYARWIGLPTAGGPMGTSYAA